MRQGSSYWRVVVLVGLLLLATACQGQDSSPVVTSAPVQDGPPPTAPFEVVTLPPVMTPTPTPLPTLVFDIVPHLGQWGLTLRFVFEDSEPIRETRFVGGVTLQVAADGSVAGESTLATGVRHDGCAARILDDGEFGFTARGSVRAGESGEEIVLSLHPTDPARLESYRLLCPDFTEPVDFERQTLWPALEALGLQPFVLPLTSGARLSQTYDVAGPTNMQLTGTLTVELSLRR